MVDRRLGRGLDFFLSGSKKDAPGSAPAEPETALEAVDDEVEQAGEEGVRELRVGELEPNPHQPRQEMDPKELADLARSIAASGVLQPILVRPGTGEVPYQIVAGERRWRAAQQAGLERVPVLLREITDDESAVFGLVENLQRSDLNALEKAEAFRSLQSMLECSQEEVAQKVGLERSSVTNFMRLLELPKEIQAEVSRGTLTMGHARALLGLRGSAAQRQAAKQVMKEQLSVRATEALVKGWDDDDPAATAKKAAPKKKKAPAWLTEIEETLMETLATPVAVQYGRKRAKIVIECAGREEFERIYRRLQGEGPTS